MTMMRQRDQKQARRSVTNSDPLEQIQNLQIFIVKWWFFACIGAATLTFLLLAGGLVVWLAGINTQGWVATICSAVPGILIKLFFDREDAAHRRMEPTRIKLEEQKEQEQENKRKKQEQEQENKRKKQKNEECESYIMHKLEAYYKGASKTDDEGKRETYYHELFGLAEYNKQRIELYFNTIPQIENEKTKKDFFRETFRETRIINCPD